MVNVLFVFFFFFVFWFINHDCNFYRDVYVVYLNCTVIRFALQRDFASHCPRSTWLFKVECTHFLQASYKIL